MSSLPNITKLIAQLEKEDEELEKETQKHFENQRNKYKEMTDRLLSIKDKAEKSIDNITKGLDYLVSNKHTIEHALERTENLDGLPISPEQQENAIDLIGKMAKFMNNTEVITLPNPISPEKIQEDVVSYTANIADELKDCKTNVQAVKSLSDKTKLLYSLTAESTGAEEAQRKLYTINEHHEFA